MLLKSIKELVPNDALRNIIITSKFGISAVPPINNSLLPMMCWNRNPVARFPKKANHGALPKSHALRRIRKRLRTGR
ncbi:conserved Plasmodium protein, unknown function [Babesia microti strain RI]|uniref:Uncharacterized protein n=1 Tax=Babesia microti (strain RI) TaxID=1133968 RepID=A0A0K3ARK0_BABMR|nr:conserved Plasmodium protein, unknown function [Babesia microti strain RI]CTQ41268.1 conserved Plasmodium protein, unknown function [Babesia microti strain RI]|eukprot:XP_012649279.1 conserved Plasmodium protein, unknown function [Babesia microti strain RI]